MPENIIIEFSSNKGELTAKISDFTQIVEEVDIENNEIRMREEFYQFGLVKYEYDKLKLFN